MITIWNQTHSCENYPLEPINTFDESRNRVTKVALNYLFLVETTSIEKRHELAKLHLRVMMMLLKSAVSRLQKLILLILIILELSSLGLSASLISDLLDELLFEMEKECNYLKFLNQKIFPALLAIDFNVNVSQKV